MKPIQDLTVVTTSDVLASLEKNDSHELQFVSLTVALADLDPAFSQSVCVQLAASSDNRVRGNALASLGHLARRYRELDEAAVKPLIEAGLADTDSYVRDSAKSAADEIYQFLHWNIAGHQYG